MKKSLALHPSALIMCSLWHVLGMFLLAGTAFAQPTVLFDTGAGTGSGYPLFGTGSTTCSPQPGCASNFQFLAGQFTLASGATLDSVQGYMSVGGAMSMAVKIYTNDTNFSGVPGTSIYSQTYSLNSSVVGWKVFSNFNPVLAAGTYWVTFEPQNGFNAQAAMPSAAPNPLPGYAYLVNGNSRWVNSAALGLGVRISGTSASPTYYTGTFTRLIQSDQVDNVDNIAGDIGRATTVSAGGSQFGIQYADGVFTSIALNGNTMTNNGPTAGAYSNSNQGIGSARGVAFATFTNNTTTTALKAEALLDGRFVHDVFGLPDGNLSAGAAVHIFDTDKFNAAINASGLSAGQFLLGGYPAFTALDPSLVFQNLAGKLSGAVIGDATVSYAGGPFYPTPIAATLSADFTVPIGKNFTVMFDVTTSGLVGGFPSFGPSGTGQVDLISTLKPAANFFTDAGGNPVTGIGVVGQLPSLPPAAAALTLAPPTGTSATGAQYTVTATATDAGSLAVPNAIVKFHIASGPNTGVSGVAATDAQGNAAFTYLGQGGAGTDSIQANIGALASNTVSVNWVTPTKCPQGQGYWKNHLNVWPVSSLILGSQTYSKAELLQILGNPGGGDASQILAVQLIAAKLNIAHGSDPAPISATIAAADRLLAGFSGKLPYKVKTSSTTGQSMTQSGATLGSYNTGQLTLSCTP